MNSVKIIEQENKVNVIEIDNPPVNALSLSLVSELSEGIDSIKDNTRVLIFKSLNKGFCAGADLKERSLMTDEQTINTLNVYKSLFDKIESLSFPTIARVHGFALGGGLEFALSCDFRFSTIASVVGFPETSIGIIPGAGGTQRMTKLAGPSKAKEWIFTAAKYTAADAYDSKIIDKIFESESKMDDYIESFSSTIARNCEIAVAAAKESINSFNYSSKLGYETERNQYLKTLKSEVRKKVLEEYKK